MRLADGFRCNMLAGAGVLVVVSHNPAICDRMHYRGASADHHPGERVHTLVGADPR